MSGDSALTQQTASNCCCYQLCAFQLRTRNTLPNEHHYRCQHYGIYISSAAAGRRAAGAKGRSNHKRLEESAALLWLLMAAMCDAEVYSHAGNSQEDNLLLTKTPCTGLPACVIVVSLYLCTTLRSTQQQYTYCELLSLQGTGTDQRCTSISTPALQIFWCWAIVQEYRHA